MKNISMSFQLLLCVSVCAGARAQLAVEVSPVKVTEQRAMVPLAFRNNFGDKIESARAVVFLLDAGGKAVGQSTKWVIGGTQDKPGLAPGATNAFQFVITPQKPPTGNLTAKISFSRIILQGGKLADPVKDVVITEKK